jgi:hypothetical protein
MGDEETREQGGVEEEGAAAFDFDVNGVRIDPESDGTPSANEPLKAAFFLCNTGTAAGTAHVTILVDGQDSGVGWDSPSLQPGECASPDGDGYVHGVPGQAEGRHTFEAVADPAGSNGGRASNEVDVGPPEN